MRKLICGLAVLGLVASLANADVRPSAQAYRATSIEAAKQPAKIVGARNLATGELIKNTQGLNGGGLRSRLPGAVFDNMTQINPNAAAPYNVSFAFYSGYTDPNGSTSAFLGALSDRNDNVNNPCSAAWDAPAYPASLLCTPWLTDVVWDEYFADPTVWPGVDLNDPAPLYRYDFIPIGSNEAAGGAQFNALNVLWYDFAGAFVGGYQFTFDFSGTFGGWFGATFDGWCADNGQGGLLFDIPGQAWVMYDWIDWDVDANGTPVGTTDADLYCRAGMMIAGGIPAFDANLPFGVDPGPNYAALRPTDLIAVGDTGSTLLRPDGAPAFQTWLWFMTNNGVPNTICGVDPAFDGDANSISYTDIFNQPGTTYPFINWYYTDLGSRVICLDYPKALYVTNACAGSNTNCRYETGSAAGEGIYNCVVDAQDLSFLLGRFGTAYDPSDFDCSGTVDAQDLAYLLGQFGNNCN